MSNIDLINPPSISLETLIGSYPEIVCKQDSVIVRGLTVATFLYSSTSTSDENQNNIDNIKQTVVAIHGGPACCHNYILPLQLLVNEGYNVLFYDQAGCGQSSSIKNVESEAPWLLTIEYYIEELRAILAHYKLTEYILYGSSWVSLYSKYNINILLHLRMLRLGYCNMSRIRSAAATRSTSYDTRRCIM